MRAPRLIVIIGLLFASTQTARSQPLIAHTASIECTVVNADLVFIAKVIKVGDAKRIEGRKVFPTTIEIEETLKQDAFTNEPYRRLQIDMPRSLPVLADWKDDSARLLVAYDEYAPHATTVIELAPGQLEIMRSDFSLLRDPDAVIRAAMDALGRMPGGTKRVHTFGRYVPRKFFTGTQWDEFHGLILNVPVDSRLEKQAIESLRSESYRERDEAVRAIRYFRSDENVARVRGLLDDPGWAYLYHAQENDGIEVRLYGVRQEAYRTLKHWGVTVNQPQIREEVRKSPK